MDKGCHQSAFKCWFLTHEVGDLPLDRLIKLMKRIKLLVRDLRQMKSGVYRDGIPDAAAST